MFLLQGAPKDLYATLLEQIGPERAAQVPAAALREPLHPNCCLSPTQFAEKFGLPEPEGNHGTDGSHGKEEEEEGDTGGGDVGVPAGTAAAAEAVPMPSDHSKIPNLQSDIKPGLRLLTVLLLTGFGVILGAVALGALFGTDHLDVVSIVQQLRSLLVR